MYFVYELVDPRTNVTGYVGITNNPNRRYYEHMEGKGSNDRKHNWIQRLQAEQIQPKMKILETVDDLRASPKTGTALGPTLYQQGDTSDKHPLYSSRMQSKYSL